MPAIRGRALPKRSLGFYGDLWRDGIHFEERGLLASDGSTKLIHDISHGVNLMFDLSRDPDELSDLVDSQPQRAARLEEELDSWDTYESAGMHWGDSQRTARRSAVK